VSRTATRTAFINLKKYLENQPPKILIINAKQHILNALKKSSHKVYEQINEFIKKIVENIYTKYGIEIANDPSKPLDKGEEFIEYISVNYLNEENKDVLSTEEGSLNTLFKELSVELKEELTSAEIEELRKKINKSLNEIKNEMLILREKIKKHYREEKMPSVEEIEEIFFKPKRLSPKPKRLSPKPKRLSPV